MLDKFFQPILWDYDISKLDYNDDIVFVRTLMFWDKKHIDILKKVLWKETFKKKFLKNLKELDIKTINYWKNIFEVNLNLKNKQTFYEKMNKPVFSRSFR